MHVAHRLPRPGFFDLKLRSRGSAGALQVTAPSSPNHHHIVSTVCGHVGSVLLDVILPNTVCSAESLLAGAGASTAFLVKRNLNIMQRRAMAHISAQGRLANPVWFRLEALC